MTTKRRRERSEGRSGEGDPTKRRAFVLFSIKYRNCNFFNCNFFFSGIIFFKINVRWWWRSGAPLLFTTMSPSPDLSRK